LSRLTGKFYRIIDANVNRAKEGLRVCEDIMRFACSDAKLSNRLKGIRHRIDLVVNSLLNDSCDRLRHRDIARDFGRKDNSFELRRTGLKDIFFANIQRAKESVRVLEELSKLENERVALSFKRLRYELYDLEKEVIIIRKKL